MTAENRSSTTPKRYKKKKTSSPVNTDSLLEQLLSNPCNHPAQQGAAIAATTKSNASVGSSCGSSSAALSAYNRYAAENNNNKSGNNNNDGVVGPTMVPDDATVLSLHSQATFSTYGDHKRLGNNNNPRHDHVTFAKNNQQYPSVSASGNDAWNSMTYWTGPIVKSRWFKRVSITLILIHCIVAAVATFDFATEHATTRYNFDLAKDMFVYVMSAELLLQFAHHGLNLFSHGWLVFDFVWVAAGWVFPNLLVMRSFRIVRTMRLASTVQDLKELVLALLLVIPKMFAIFLLLLVLFFVFSILFTDLFKHTYDEEITQEDYFSSIEVTLFTLFQIMTLDGWAEICKEVMTVHEWAWIPFIGFVIVSSFFFLNLVIAVVCDAVTSVHRDTVVKYIQDDISAATSVREALQVEDKLEELASAIQVIMHSQVTLLDTLHQQSQQGQNETSTGEQGLSSLMIRTSDVTSQLDNTRAALKQQLEVVGSRRRGRSVSGSYASSVPLNPLNDGSEAETPSDSVSALDQHSYTKPQGPTQITKPLSPILSTPPELLTIPSHGGSSSPESLAAHLSVPPLPHGLEEHEVSVLNTAQRQRLVRVLQQDQFKELSATQRAKLAHALINRLATEGQEGQSQIGEQQQKTSVQDSGPANGTTREQDMQELRQSSNAAQLLQDGQQPLTPEQGSASSGTAPPGIFRRTTEGP